MGLFKDDPPPPPNMMPLAEASIAQAQIQQQIAADQLNWAKQQFAENKGVTDRVVDQFLQTQDVNAANAAKDRQRYENVFQPLEDDLVRDARDYATPERRDLEVGRAQAGVAQQFDAARANAIRELESFGINPASTRFAALDIGARTQQAAAAAAAGNQASEMVDAKQRALRSEAINIGRGMPGQVAGTYNTALQAGTGAVNSGLATTASGSNTMGNPTAWSNMSGQNIGRAGDIMNVGYANALKGYEASQKASSGLGTALGLAGAFFFEDGGAVPGPEDAPGAVVPAGASPTQGIETDDVNARLNVGEFVVPEDVTRWLGEEKLQKMIEKARQDKQGAPAKPKKGQAIPGAPSFQSPNTGGQAIPLQ